MDDRAGSEFVAYLLDQLRAWALVGARRMFSGHGLYRGETIFALVLRDALFLRADAVSRDDYVAAGMQPFRYDRRGRSVEIAYYEVPADLLENPDDLARWADKAYGAALRVAAAKPKSRKAGGTAAGKKATHEKTAGPTRPAKRTAGDKPAGRRVKHAE